MFNGEGRKISLKALYDKLNTVVTEKMNYRRVIKQEIRKLSACISKNEKYVAFKQVR